MTNRENIFTSPVITAVGAVVFRGDEVLIIRRGREPLKGQWSIPGGKVEYGERLHDAAAREVCEETGVEIRVLGLLDVFESLPSPSQGGDRGPAGQDAPAEDAAKRLSASDNKGAPHYVMVDYAAEWVSGEPKASDDAEAAEFVSLEEAERRIAWDTTRRAIARAAEWRRQNRGKGRAQGPTLS